MPSPVAVAWLTLDMVGLFSLLFLLATFVFAKSLPQRKNPFLINLILATFLATIPPCLLFITGNQDSDPPTPWICSVQSFLMDGVAPMFGTAFLVLVVHTWSELRATLKGSAPFMLERGYLKWGLLLAPYIVMMAWTVTSAVIGTQPSAVVELSSFVYCATYSSGAPVRQFNAHFMIVCGAFQLFFDVWIAYILIAPLKIFQATQRQKLTTTYHGNISITLRILIFSILQVTPIILAVLNRNHNHLYYPPLKVATEILESLDAFVTFLVFGTQRDVLNVWKFWNYPWKRKFGLKSPECSHFSDTMV